MSLREYARKRRFGATPEPAQDAGTGRGKRGKAPIFVVQLHHASHRHYDFRLEVDGALKSWAVPKGPSLRKGEKRLAVEVEDHPLSYAGFEGDIPKGNYGAGHVDVFDSGTWSVAGEPLAAIAAGKLDFVLHGSKLRGGWKLVRTGKAAAKPQWLLIKRDDEFAADAEADDLVGAAPGWRERALALPKARARAFPVPFTPQLCASREAAPRGDDWLHEIKWDGYRLLAELDAGKAKLRTRNGLDWTAKFPEVAAAIASLPVRSARLDGELVALDDKGRSDFSALQRALKAGESERLTYIAFDMPGVEGVDLSGCALLARKQLLEQLLDGHASGALNYSKHIVGHGEKVFAASKGQGVEGIISKRIDAPYVQSRSTTWVKVKHEDSDEFVVVGYTQPKGARSSFGSLLMARRERGRLVYAGRVGTGFDEAGLRDVHRQLVALAQTEPVLAIPAHATISAKDVHWVKPRLVAEVAFRGWGKEGLLRQAAFKTLRADKSPAELQPATESSAITITHPERVVYAAPKTTKGDVADYYRAVAPWILPELANRPLSLLRCPAGAEGHCFFQKHHLDSLGEAVKSIRLKQKDGVEDYLYIDDVDGLLALVQMNTIEFHPWGSRIDAPEQPDRLVFDLDPAEGLGWPQVLAAARDVRERLREVKLESFVRVTGGKGLHVVVPIERGPTWQAVKDFSGAFAEAMVSHRPQAYVATMSKAKRGGKIFIDWLRNARGSTSVTSWSLRARAGAPVAVPLHWEDLGRLRAANSFDLAKAKRRAAALRADPWADLYALKQKLP